jgi:hypothetical protein
MHCATLAGRTVPLRCYSISMKYNVSRHAKGGQKALRPKYSKRGYSEHMAAVVRVRWIR